MSEPANYGFMLLVAVNAPNSIIAIANLKSVCRDYLPMRHEVEIVDVFIDPKRALADRIILTPMPIKHSPASICKIIRNLSQRPFILLALGLPN
jgi:circadian clock protein KaiB